MKAFIAFFLLISQAFAGSLCVRVVENQCGQNGCSRVDVFGTAVVLSQTQDDFWIAITAKHVVGNAKAADISVGLEGRWYPVDAVYRLTSNDDAAFIAFAYNGTKDKLKGVPVAEEDIEPGEPIKFSGYSGGTKFEAVRGKVTQAGFARVDVRPQQGQSGGGVYDRHGRLIGIVTHYDGDGNLVYCPITRVRRRCIREWGFFWGIGMQAPAPPPPVVGIPVAPMAPPTPIVPPSPAAPEKPSEPRIVEKGCQCKDGCTCDQAVILELQAAIARLKSDNEKLKATKIPVQILRPDGTLFDEAEYTLGKPIKLKLAPVEKK